MSIEYEKSGEVTKLTFGMVEEDQFFYDLVGNLCQRLDTHRYQVIADNTGKPLALPGNHCYPTVDQRIKSICKEVVKIAIEIEQEGDMPPGWK